MRNWMTPDQWFPVKACVLSQGTGRDENGLGALGVHEGGLGAWDASLHDRDGAALARLNFHQVSSVVPRGVPVYRLDRKRALDIDPAGMQAPAVWKDVRTNRGETITAGVGIGVPDDPYQTGIIFTAGGPITAEECETILRVQVTRGMTRREPSSNRMELHGDRWTFHTAIATSEQDPARPDAPDVWRAATALLWFQDEYAWQMYRGVLDPL